MFKRLHHRLVCLRRGVFSANLIGTHHIRHKGNWEPFAREWKCDGCGIEGVEYLDTGECDLF